MRWRVLLGIGKRALNPAVAEQGKRTRGEIAMSDFAARELFLPICCKQRSELAGNRIAPGTSVNL